MQKREERQLEQERQRLDHKLTVMEQITESVVQKAADAGTSVTPQVLDELMAKIKEVEQEMDEVEEQLQQSQGGEI